MSAHVIDGRARARQLEKQLVDDVARSRADGLRPGLATVMVGRPYSCLAYEARIARLAERLGVVHRAANLPERSSQQEVLAVVAELNAAEDVSGILILRPLPPQIDEAGIFRTIDPLKDVEAVHPENAGLLALGVPRFVPSTAASVFDLLDHWLDSVGEDRQAFYHRSTIVVVGRSNNVGKPCISLGYQRQATVESVDEWASRAGRLGRHTRRADVLVVAVGRPGLIRAEHVSDDAVVIDVGINPVTAADGTTTMVGDVDFPSTAARVRAITPVPGGVGPVTDVWLLRSTVLAARLQAGLLREPALAHATTTPRDLR
ncbi:bifunctional 5,10-methylenetetrahydrofolate dehydrogenase/5,10-methenyltetrahydrofolate cyclohydrolase [Mycolicibacterium sp. CBMA 226]|uniref:bifunctional 5,10-methylenetetrahydrofolate dehydrogenase/5,10-methenyltetrahydrofolate cyclohydrolase n=1 Tax=Mycolicibacterium sp. CBMA 226 TaxID=2606611 RepID=UPI001308A07C|nr:tetrahydrofolate dehydrogenase/cyclohydrolase catalytic domain-containing protein [Mycolicibacterium sp. CBMA 226]MUL78998.1 bifunctional 5,10-methylene-tetrahydrofolate dehydrogenase/5,10-methylene-tetrahydrofolate cyclohydrolase [Mycolicibacterium sp. CBMA 226]QGW61314.1 Bifunctional protein FolD protein [Mycolicibacterium sp.]